MEKLLEFLISNAPGVFLGFLFGVGLPLLIKSLRRDSAKKLADKDPRNDSIAKIENDLADILETKIKSNK